MPTTNASNTLTLTNKAGQNLILTDKGLTLLFAEAELSLHQNKNNPKTAQSKAQLSHQLLARSGLQTPLQVIEFLKSPEGLSTIAMINEELYEIAAMEEGIQQQILEQKLKQKYRLAFLLLGLLHNRATHARELSNSHAAQEYEKKLRQNKEKAHAEQATAVSNIESPDEQEYALAAYHAQIIELEKAYQSKIDDFIHLIEKQTQIEAQYGATKEKYATYHEHIDAIHNAFNEDASIKLIEEKIAVLTTEIDKISVQFMKLVDEDDEAGANKLRDVITARASAIGELHDMLAVKKGDKVLYNKDFEPVTSFTEAKFILAGALKVVNKNGKKLLIKSTQNPDEMCLEAQATAEKEFKLLNAEEMMSVKNLIQHNFSKEEQIYHSKKETLSAESELMQATLLLLQNQLLELQATQSNVELSLKLTKPTPAMTMAPVPSATPKNERWISDNYKQILVMMRQNQTPESIAWLKLTLANPNGSNELRKQLNELRPGVHIPPETIKNLLATNPLASALLQLKHPNGPTKEASTARFNPTPFPKDPYNHG